MKAHPEQFSAMPHTTLQSLIQYLGQEYYQPAELCCQKVNECIIEIHGGDNAQTASLYTTLCKKLTEHVDYYLMLRRDFLQPYMARESTAKKCDDYCRHQLQTVSVQIQELLCQLRGVVPPVPHETHVPDWDSVLHQEIKKLDERLTEMFYLEQSALVQAMDKTGATDYADVEFT